MSTIKTALHDAQEAVADIADQVSPEEMEQAASEARRSRSAIFAGYDDLRSVRMAIQHRVLRAVLMKLHGVQPVGEDAFNARLKHILDLELVTDRRPNGRGWRTYGLVDVFEIALCLQLQRSFIPPATAVRFIVENRAYLDKFWSEGAKGSAPRLYVEVDAFAAIGATGRDNGRGSRGNEVGTISMSRLGHLDADAIPPSSLIIDLNDLQRRVQDQLVRVGVRDVLSRARESGCL
ncbi:hypothetical protein [Sphingobium sp. DC-2]|uniref:hypothetical protein n=1 Tax=Sphingobium sp. DC-2 TaxID=1303256 RepID=UPI0012DE24B0|nr:hypothetical protein [Sphingobium sp. DC-2]